MLPMLGVHLALIALPGIAGALLGIRGGMRSVPVLLALALATTASISLLGFWAYYGDPVLGETLSYLTLFGSVAVMAWTLPALWRRQRSLLRDLAVPLVLWALGALFLLCFGFLHGGEAEPLAAGATRFSHPLPGDSYIPEFYAEWFFANGHSGASPLFYGEWHSSDRPPLQVGFVLLQLPFGWGEPQLQYQVLGVVLQQLWIVGLWALLIAARVGRTTRALAMVLVLLSPVAIVNGFFVWPKLLPAALLLAAAALTITPEWENMRRWLPAGLLLAALLALAMMGHGSSAFGVIPLALVAAWRALPSRRWVGVALVTGVVVLAPWLAYQKYADPPGNRVTKWMLAGAAAIDDRGTGEAFLDAYRGAGFGGAVDNKASNFLAMVGGETAIEQERAAAGAIRDGDFELAVRNIRLVWFFNLLPSFGLLLIAPFVMLAKRRRAWDEAPREWAFALTCLLVLAIGALAWGLILFGNEVSETVLHQGSYLLPILGICGGVAGLRAAMPRFALYYLAATALFTLAVYVPVLDPLQSTSLSIPLLLLGAAGLTGFVAVAARDSPS